MVDDGSAINVCPLQILPNLGVKVEELTKFDLVELMMTVQEVWKGHLCLM